MGPRYPTWLNLCIFFCASCNAGAGLIGDARNDGHAIAGLGGSASPEATWQETLTAWQGLITRSNIELLNAVRLEAEADAADARNDATAAAELRRQADLSFQQASALQIEAERKINEAQTMTASIEAEQVALQNQLDNINNAQDPLSIELQSKLNAKKGILDAINATRTKIAALAVALRETRWQISLRQAFTDGHANRRSNWRIGIGGNPVRFADRHDLKYLGWYFSWAIGGSNGLGYVPEKKWDFVSMVARDRNCLFSVNGTCKNNLPLPEYEAQLRKDIDGYPTRFPNGSIFTVGNENAFDDARSPLDYANAHCAVYKTVKNINPDFLVSSGATLPTSKYYFVSNSPVRPWKYLNQAEQNNYRNYLVSKTGADIVAAHLGNTLTPTLTAAEEAVYDAYSGPKPDWIGFGLGKRVVNNITGLEYWDAIQASVPNAPNCSGFSKLPVDVYNLHMYPFHDHTSGKSTDPERIVEGLKRFRGRMKAWHEEDKPLIITELGTGNQNSNQSIGYPGPASGNWPSYDARALASILDALFSATDSAVGMPSDGNHLAQRWAWFMLAAEAGHPEWDATMLYTASGDVTVRPECVVVQPGQPCQWDPGRPFKPLATIYREKGVQYMPEASAYQMSTAQSPMGLAQTVSGGMTYRDAKGVHGKWVEFFARVACSSGAMARVIVNRKTSAGQAQDYPTSETARCDGSWNTLRFTYEMPVDTTGFTAWIELRGPGKIKALVDDFHAEGFTKPMAERAMGERGQALFRNTGFEFGVNLSRSMGKTNPEPWYVVAPQSYIVAETKVVPWRDAL